MAGYSGRIADKFNRALLSKRKKPSDTLKEGVFGKESVTKLNLKKSTPRDMWLIKQKIVVQKKRNRIIDQIAFVLTVLVVLAIVFLFSTL